MKRSRGRAALALLTLALVSAAWAAPEGARNEPDSSLLEARIFEVRHRPLVDAAEVVEPLLSPAGELSLQPRLRTLVVVDRVAHLDRIGTLLASFDVPPRTVELTLTLFVGTDQSEAEAGRVTPPEGISQGVVDVMEKLRVFTKYVGYEVLGSRAVQGIEGGHVAATLSDGYRVELEIDAVQELQQTVRFKKFSLQRVIQTSDGARHEEVYSAAVVSPVGRLQLVGAASGPDSSRALFLALQTELR